MLTERQVQFRIGLMTLVALVIGGWLIAEFGELRQITQRRYPLFIHFSSGSGLYPTAPVTLSGIPIGTVKSLDHDTQRGGVIVRIEIREKAQLPIDSHAIVIRSILGETIVDIVPGKETVCLRQNETLEGETAVDPLEMVQRMEGRAIEVLDALGKTSHEWQLVASNVNSLLETNRGNLGQVVERAADSLHEFTVTMRHANNLLASANRIVGDPDAQKALQETLLSMPRLVNETQKTIQETRTAIGASRQVLDNVNRNLENLTLLTDPVGKRGELMVEKLDSSLSNLDQLLSELTRFSKLINSKDGTLQRFATDPSLYKNLDRSSQSLVVMLKNLEPTIKDLREFSDKVARNPELLGVGGAVRPSTGLKDAELLKGQKPVARGNNGQ